MKCRNAHSGTDECLGEDKNDGIIKGHGPDKAYCKYCEDIFCKICKINPVSPKPLLKNRRVCEECHQKVCSHCGKESAGGLTRIAGMNGEHTYNYCQGCWTEFAEFASLMQGLN